MMNPNMIKQNRNSRWKKKGKVLLFGSMLLSACFAPVMPVLAEETAQSESQETEPPKAEISIDKPSGWKQGDTKVTVTVDGSHLGKGITITKLEAKIGENGTWADITADPSIHISGNVTVYVKATDSQGNTYEQNRSIKCYDSEKPTLTASLTDGVLAILGTDTVSGIKSITVNGTEYTDLTDGMLKIQLTQKDFTTKKIEITATDHAGNVSDTYSLQNPYYEWAVKQAMAQAEKADMATVTGTAETEPVTAPLPQTSTPSEPTTSTGTVTDRTITGIEEELATKDETVDSISTTKTAAGKEFYTISTKSGKVFYLIIDNEQSTDNVYFLTEVDNKDLMNFTLSDTVELPHVDTVYASLEETEKETEPVTEKQTEAETETEIQQVPQKADSSGMAAYLLIGLIAVGAGAGAWYMKIYKPKHEFDDEEDEYDPYEQDGEPYVNEDEQPVIPDDDMPPAEFLDDEDEEDY